MTETGEGVRDLSGLLDLAYFLFYFIYTTVYQVVFY
jgi:hypothetical protein